MERLKKIFISDCHVCRGQFSALPMTLNYDCEHTFCSECTFAVVERFVSLLRCAT